MHRLIMDAPADLQVDHINGNPLDNRRCNMRLCTNQENHYNRQPIEGSTSRFKGVSRTGKRWLARIHFGGREIYLGCFGTEEEAAKAFDTAASYYQGEFAYLNFKEAV